jgi:hypothetical protein
MDISISIISSKTKLKVLVSYKFTRKPRTFRKVIIDKESREITVKNSYVDLYNRFTPLSDDEVDVDDEYLELSHKENNSVLKYLDKIEKCKEDGLCYIDNISIIDINARAEVVETLNEDDFWCFHHVSGGFVNLNCKQNFKYKRTFKELAKIKKNCRVKDFFDYESFKIIGPHNIVKSEKITDNYKVIDKIHFNENYTDFLQRLYNEEHKEEILLREKILIDGKRIERLREERNKKQKIDSMKNKINMAKKIFGANYKKYLSEDDLKYDDDETK